MSQAKRTFGIVLCVFCVGLLPAGSSRAQQSASLVESLIRGSDYVGFVQAEEYASVSDSPWKKHVAVFSQSPLKGIIVRDSRFGEFPPIWGDGPEVMRLPNFYAEKGEYLVFLRQAPDKPEKKEKHWVTLAAFRVEYRADRTGHAVGYMTGDASLDRDFRVASASGPVAASLDDEADRPRLPRPASDSEELTAIRARQCLQTILDGKGDLRSASRTLDRFVVQAVIDNSPAVRARVITFEQRLLRAQRLASGVRIGTSRADVERIFPKQDGGLSGPGDARYLVGFEIIVEVRYEGTRDTNVYADTTVNGPLRLYRGYGNID